MDFELTTEQRGLIDASRSLMAAKASMATTRSLIERSTGFDSALWGFGVDLGWPALGIPESDGGLGQQAIDLALVAIEQGRALVSTPFIPTVVVADAIRQSAFAGRAKLLHSLAEGFSTAAWAFAEFGRPWSIAGIETTAHPQSSGGYLLRGSKASVQDADSAQFLLVDALLEGSPARFVVPTDAVGVRVDPQCTLDVARRYCDVHLEDVAVGSDAVCVQGPAAEAAIARSAQLSSVLVCAELVGIGQQLLDMTTRYVQQRVQFGKPIGSFQAVKHKCADIRIWVQASEAATLYAGLAVDSDHENADMAVSVAKAYTSDAIVRAAGEALQLHGGIGFTWEHDLHLYLRRARVNAMLHGDTTEHRERLCRLASGSTRS